MVTRMIAQPTIGEAVAAYLTRLSAAERDVCATELNRFGRWFGFDRPLTAIQPADLERYQEQLGPSADARRLEPLRGFLSDARARKLLETSLAVHVRIRKKSTARSAGKQQEATTIQMTRAGYDNLKAELDRLERDVRPQVQADMQRAAADKDMRE